MQKTIKLIWDTEEKTLLTSFNPRKYSPQKLAPLFQNLAGESVVPVNIYPVRKSGIYGSPLEQVDLTGSTIGLNFIRPGTCPQRGVWSISDGVTSSEDLPPNSSAALVEKQLNLILGGGAVKVTGPQCESGPVSSGSGGECDDRGDGTSFKVYWQSTGVVPLLEVASTELSPPFQGSVSRIVTGDATHREEQLVTLFESSLAYNETWVESSGSGFLVYTDNEGGPVGVKEVQTIYLTGQALSGAFTITAEEGETGSLSIFSSAAQVQAALDKIAPDSYSVSSDSPFYWTVTFLNDGAHPDLSISSHNLVAAWWVGGEIVMDSNPMMNLLACGDVECYGGIEVVTGGNVYSAIIPEKIIFRANPILGRSL